MLVPEGLGHAHPDLEVVGHGEPAVLQQTPGEFEAHHEFLLRHLEVGDEGVTVRHREGAKAPEAREFASLLRAERVPGELVEREGQLLV